MTPDGSASRPVLLCSAKGCHAAAAWGLQWNNPKLHPPERRKTWLACDEHRASLADFLRARGFLRDVEPLDPDSDPGSDPGSDPDSDPDSDTASDPARPAVD